MTAITTATPTTRRIGGIDISVPVLYFFAALLCILIVLPLSWLVIYSLTDRNGALTLANFERLFSESAFMEPLLTTLKQLDQVAKARPFEESLLSAPGGGTQS